MLVFCLLATTATSAALQSGHFTYTINPDGTTVTITDYTGGGGAVVIPSIIDSKPVTSLGDYAFHIETSLTSISIPDSVVSIGYSVFSSCTSLTSVNIPDSVESIGDYAFSSCSGLTSLTLGSSVTNIGDLAFASCSGLDSISIPDSVISIGVNAFTSCSALKNIMVGNGVTAIDDFAFTSCTNLMGAYFHGNAPSLGVNVFAQSGSESVIYYRAGATGWGSSFGGRPTVFWNPLIQINDGSFGVRTNRFGFNIAGSGHELIVVESSANLIEADWELIVATNLTSLLPVLLNTHTEVVSKT